MILLNQDESFLAEMVMVRTEMVFNRYADWRKHLQWKAYTMYILHNEVNQRKQVIMAPQSSKNFIHTNYTFYNLDEGDNSPRKALIANKQDHFLVDC